jgi:hypothetical protein
MYQIKYVFQTTEIFSYAAQKVKSLLESFNVSQGGLHLDEA